MKTKLQEMINVQKAFCKWHRGQTESRDFYILPIFVAKQSDLQVIIERLLALLDLYFDYPCFLFYLQLLLMKKGGQLIYGGPLGKLSKTMIQYFEVRTISGYPELLYQKKHVQPTTKKILAGYFGSTKDKRWAKSCYMDVRRHFS